jgi:FKBP-type peptidyl-prolyl cis-trans isomerase SlyD
MNIETNSVVSVSYQLSSKSTGETKESIVETTKPGDPFVFLFGKGGLIEGFENNLRGKKIGDKFDFYIPSEQAYGAIDLENIVNVPVNVFHDDKGKVDYEMVKVGKTLPMTDNEGNRMHGTVQEVTGEHVRMDFNHPLAGQELHFVGEVLEIRPATADELTHGHVHGKGGHHH